MSYKTEYFKCGSIWLFYRCATFTEDERVVDLKCENEADQQCGYLTDESGPIGECVVLHKSDAQSIFRVNNSQTC